MKKFYKNSDITIFWDLAKSQKAKLIVKLNEKLKNWFNECVQATMDKWHMGVEEVEINVTKGVPFFKCSKLENSNGKLEVGVTVYYNNGDCEDFHKNVYWNGRDFI